MIDEGATDAGGKHDVLLVVFVVGQDHELGDEMADITVGVDNVGCLGEADVSKRELAELSGIVDANVIEDGEGTADSHRETATAVSVETTSSAVDSADKQIFVVR